MTVMDAAGTVIAEVIGAAVAGVADALRGRAKRAAEALYELEWMPASAAERSALTGRWLVVSADEEAAAALVAELQGIGSEPCLCEPGSDCRGCVCRSRGLPVAGWRGRGGWAGCVAAGDHGAVDRAGDCELGTTAAAVVDDAGRGCRRRWCQQLPVGGRGVGAGPHGACRSALNSVARWSTWRASIGRREALERELATFDDEPQVAWRSGQRLVARLVRAPARDRTEIAFAAEGTVLVTGGLGGLGLHVARWLVAGGVKHLVLTGRRGLETPGAQRGGGGARGAGRAGDGGGGGRHRRGSACGVACGDASATSAARGGACGRGAGRRRAGGADGGALCGGDAAQGGRRVEPASGDGGARARLLRAVLVGGGHAGLGGAGHVCGGQRLPRCAGVVAACRGACGDQPGLGRGGRKGGWRPRWMRRSSHGSPVRGCWR